MSNIIREVLSGENQVLSSKRIFGALIFLVCLGCIVYLVANEGGTQVVENLLQTAMFMAAGLLGISTVTGIWRDSKKSHNMDATPPPASTDPCE